MAKRLAYQRQAGAVSDRETREGMAQIMEPQIGKPCLHPHPVPGFL